MTGRPTGIAATRDQLAAIWVLKTLGWSDRAVARALNCSPSSIPVWFKEAREVCITEEDYDRRHKSLAAKEELSGTSDDVSARYAQYHQNPCGGGRKSTEHIYDEQQPHVT